MPEVPETFNDSPITSPTQDQFGIDHFARAIARSLREMESPSGVTIAVNGPWGSGKSSAINLIRHHLAISDDPNLVVVDFTPWWFRGEEALTIAFLQALDGALEKSIGKQISSLIPRIGKKLLQAGSVAGAAAGAIVGPAGTIVSSSMDFASRFFSDSESVEKIFSELSTALRDQSKRFVVVMDDIDRLAPDEALLIFRLIKSVGRLPNVIYLLAFDRELAEKAVEQRYPSDTRHFLEKIIQASFELPPPDPDELRNQLLTVINEKCGIPEDGQKLLRFMNIFYDGIAPYVTLPRDLVRITNSLAVAWPAVAGEVDVADYVALEMIRLFELKLYNRIRDSKDDLCGPGRREEKTEVKERRLKSFVELVSESRREYATAALQRLFPSLENVGYDGDFADTWRADRLLCTPQHFETYFRMTIGERTLSRQRVDEIIARCGDEGFILSTLDEGTTSIRRSGKSLIPLLLDELNIHAARITDEQVPSLVSAIFRRADSIERDPDSEDAGIPIRTHLRIHWLIRKLTFNRYSLDDRTGIFMNACASAQLGWLVDFASSAVDDYFPRQGKERESPDKCLIAENKVPELKALALAAIQDAATRGTLIDHPKLAWILFRWRDFAADGGKAVQEWSNSELKKDASVPKFARAFTGESSSQGLGMFNGLADRVAMRHKRAAVKGAEDILDVGLFRLSLERLAEEKALPVNDREAIGTLLLEWQKMDRGDDD